MESTGLTLEYISTQDMLWHDDEENPHLFFFRKPNSVWQAIEKSELDALDTRLFPVLGQLTPLCGWSEAGRNLCHTVNLWRGSYVQLPTLIGSYPQYIAEVLSIDGFDDNDIKFTAMIWETKEVNGAPYVVNRNKYLLSEPFDWLEKTYPQAKSRLKAGMGLELPQEELIRYVFDNSPAPPTEAGHTLLREVLDGENLAF